jgi:hypothetical protein
MNKEILKTAAATLRALKDERDELTKEKDTVKLARAVVTQLVAHSELSSKDVLEKLAEFELKTSEELHVIQKAIEYAGSGNLIKLGVLAMDTQTSDPSMDNLTAFLINGDSN